MILNELHIFQWSARAIGQRHPIAGLNRGICSEAEYLAAAAGTQNNGLGGNRLDLSGGQFQRHHSLRAAIVHQQPGSIEFVVANDSVVFQRGLKQRVQHVETGLVGREPRACLFHPAEWPDGNAPVRFPAPRTTPMFKPHQLLRRLLYECFHGVLIAEPVAAGDRVVGVVIQTVVFQMNPGGPALGGHRMTPHRVHF